jgi:hypothetical protein
MNVGASTKVVERAGVWQVRLVLGPKAQRFAGILDRLLHRIAGGGTAGQIGEVNPPDATRLFADDSNVAVHLP